MRLHIWALLAVSAISGSAIPGRCDRFPVTVRDARGVPVTLKAAPRRIVSLSPGTTEMLFAVGAGPRIVGDTVWCDYPPAARAIPKIGDVTPNYERIVAAHPDLVVVDEVAEKAAPARLQALHLPVFVIKPTGYLSVEATLVALGRITGNQHAGIAARAEMERKRLAAQRLTQSLPRRPGVTIVIGTGPLWAAGPQTFVGDVVALAGGQVVGGPAGSYGTLSKEWLIGHQPDMIMASPHDQDALRHDSVLSHLTAVRTGRFVDTDGEVLMRPGPRLADGLVLVAAALKKLATR